MTGTAAMAAPVKETVAPLAEQAANGTLLAQIQAVLPLEQALEGLATLASGQAHGKIVVSLDRLSAARAVLPPASLNAPILTVTGLAGP